MPSYLLDNMYNNNHCSSVLQSSGIFSNSVTVSAKAQSAALLPSCGIGNYLSFFFGSTQPLGATRPCLPCYACIVPDDDRGIVEIRRSTGAPRWRRGFTTRGGDGKLYSVPTTTCLIQPRQRFFWKNTIGRNGYDRVMLSLSFGACFWSAADQLFMVSELMLMWWSLQLCYHPYG
jgi:hypothetical protein